MTLWPRVLALARSPRPAPTRPADTPRNPPVNTPALTFTDHPAGTHDAFRSRTAPSRHGEHLLTEQDWSWRYALVLPDGTTVAFDAAMPETAERVARVVEALDAPPTRRELAAVIREIKRELFAGALAAAARDVS
ncbi:hypothetical protein [Streptomyces sp. NPDC087300]|uniref:hypothetical protein n=1 Tax=Streptomyces sp. NPDC087300 TaxID=3365780 RepID=UPI0037F87E66